MKCIIHKRNSQSLRCTYKCSENYTMGDADENFTHKSTVKLITYL